MISMRFLTNAAYEQLLRDDLRVHAKRDEKNWETHAKLDNNNDLLEIRLTVFVLSPIKAKFTALQLS